MLRDERKEAFIGRHLNEMEQICAHEFHLLGSMFLAETRVYTRERPSSLVRNYSHEFQESHRISRRGAE